MPSFNQALDLEAWAGTLPKERNNDYEFNLLLYKFKSFYNEVKEYQRLHLDCAVTRNNDDNNNKPNQPKLVSSSSMDRDGATGTGRNGNNNGSTNMCQLTRASLPSGSKHVMDLRKRFTQNQDTPGLPQHNQAQLKQPELRHQNQLERHRDSYARATAQHYNSSHNLSSFNPTHQGSLTNSCSYNPNPCQDGRPIMSSRLLSSKSSERLDISGIEHNNHDKNIRRADLSKPQNVPMVRDSRYLNDDDNIYDDVSPDDLQVGDNNYAAHDSAGSIHDLSRLSSMQNDKLGASRNSLIINPHRSAPRNVKLTDLRADSEVEQSNQSFNSSILLDSSNNTSSNLSLMTNYTNQDLGNYVNIDFFLKRNRSPSFDGIEENSSEVSDEDTTQVSHSISSERLCDMVNLEGIPASNPHRNSSSNDNHESSNSITPASSGDFIDDGRNSNMNQTSEKHFDQSSFKFSSFLASSLDVSETSHKNVPSREAASSKYSLPHQRTLDMIQENREIAPKSNQEQSLIEHDTSALAEANSTMRSFLSDLNLSPIEDAFGDKAQRRIVKESFAVEFCGRRKLRHLFLFNDVIVCAKYQASSKQKFTFDVKWYLSLDGVSVSDLNDANQAKQDREVAENQILAIRTNLMLLRGRMQQIKRSKDKKPSKLIKKLKKKRTELEADLVLLLPHLPLIVKHTNGKKYTFFLSSNFDRNQWIESIKFLQSQLSISKTSSTPSSSELQAWIQTCRKNLNPSLGTFLLRSNCDDDLLYGDLHLSLNFVNGVSKPGHYYFCFEVDSYGHFTQKASSAVINVSSSEQELTEEYVFPLDGAHSLRILLYEDFGAHSKPSVIGKAQVELSRALFVDKTVQKVIEFNTNTSLLAQLSYSNSDLLSLRISHTKLCPTFGLDITQVCRKEKTNIPLLIQLCINEVERRGMREVGIYRMSGTSTDIQRLKRAFEMNPYVAELLLRDIDINSVTGFLKTYLREMPEGLFINKLYPRFVSAFNIPQTEMHKRTKTMIDLFHQIPVTNQLTIIYLVDHLVKVNKYETINKMSITNLATVLGPNILKAPTDSSVSGSSDPFTAVVIGSMSQAGILYFFLNRRASNLPLTEMDPSELAKLPIN